MAATVVDYADIRVMSSVTPKFARLPGHRPAHIKVLYAFSVSAIFLPDLKHTRGNQIIGFIHYILRSGVGSHSSLSLE